MMTRQIEYNLPGTGLVSAEMPRQIRPMLSLSGRLPNKEKLFGFEYKWDGVRVIYFWNGEKAFLQSRNMLDITDMYHEIKPLGSTFGSTRIIFDGEIIALGRDGLPSFDVLQQRFGLGELSAAIKRSKDIPVIYMIFDILYFDHYSLFGVPYRQRREMLDGFGIEGDAWQVPPWQEGSGAAMLENAKRFGLEGIVAKRLDSNYEPDTRSGAWMKIKIVKRQEFVIGGWTPLKNSNMRMIGSLLVGYYKNGEFVFAGSVGTGFSEEDRRNLRDLLERNKAVNPFNVSPRSDAVYTEPKFVAEVEFRAWTSHGILRQASFKGMRFDKDAKEVVLEEVTTKV